MCICDVTRSRHFLFLKATLSLKDFPRAKKTKQKETRNIWKAKTFYTHTQTKPVMLAEIALFLCVCVSFVICISSTTTTKKTSEIKKKKQVFPFLFEFLSQGRLLFAKTATNVINWTPPERWRDHRYARSHLINRQPSVFGWRDIGEYLLASFTYQIGCNQFQSMGPPRSFHFEYRPNEKPMISNENNWNKSLDRCVQLSKWHV